MLTEADRRRGCERAVVRTHDIEDPGGDAEHRQEAEKEQHNPTVCAVGHRRRHDHEFPAAEPERDGREQHHRGGYAEGHPRAVGIQPYRTEIN